MKKRLFFVLFIVLVSFKLLGFSEDYNTIKSLYRSEGNVNVKPQPTKAYLPKKITKKIDIGDIVVTPRKIEENISLVPESVFVIKKDTIKKYSSLEKLLNNVSGIFITKNSGFEGVSSVILRGSSSRQSLVLLDGIPLNDIMTGGADLNSIELENVKKVEVVEGGLSNVYGENALSGVINIITNEEEKFKIDLKSSYGLFNTQKNVFTLTAPIFNSFLSIGGVEAKSDGYILNTDYLKRVFNAKYKFSNDFLSSKIVGYYFKREMGIPGSKTFQTPNAHQIDENFNIGVEEYLTSDFSDFKVNAYMRSGDMLYKNEPQISRHIKKEYFVNLAHIYNKEDYISVLSGYEYKNQYVNSTDIGEKTINNYAFYNNSSILLFNVLVLNGSVRYDKNSQYEDITTEKGGILYKFSNNIDIFGNIYNSFSSPTFGDLFWPEQTSWGITTKGNPELKVENAKGYEVGIEKKDKKIHEKFVWFRKDVENLISWIFDTATFTYYPININKARIMGLNVDFSYMPFDFLDISFQYTYLNATDVNTKMKLANIPEGKVTGQVNIKLPLDTEFFINGEYVDNRLDTTGNVLKYYYVFNANIVHKINKNLKVFLNAENIFNEKYEILSGYEMPRRMFMAGIEGEF